MIIFKNRAEAGSALAKKLKHYKACNGVILAVPRGGVPVGKVIAEALEIPLEIVLSKKIGHPDEEEYAIGAVNLETRILNPDIEVSQDYIDDKTRYIRELLYKQSRLYYKDRKPESLEGKIAIIVDDGIATGYTILSIAELISYQIPRKVVVAVPVASSTAVEKLQESGVVDEVICLAADQDFLSVGRYYESFPQVEDEEVISLLTRFYGRQDSNNSNAPAQKKKINITNRQKK